MEYVPDLRAFVSDTFTLEVMFTEVRAVTALLIAEVMVVEMFGVDVGTPERTSAVLDSLDELVDVGTKEEFVDDGIVGFPERTNSVLEPVAKLVALTTTEVFTPGNGVGPPDRIKPVPEPVAKLLMLTTVAEVTTGPGVELPEITNSVLKAELISVTPTAVLLLGLSRAPPEATLTVLNPVEYSLMKTSTDELTFDGSSDVKVGP